ncbi:MAG: 2-hydroxymuconic semialdehyde dehydrogenase [Kangiellaceae bacterium]|nr:2-hydroxymuconic semialdehyde dehydrogenase [Kangiellaceae bacterium]
MRELRNYIDGKFMNSERKFDVSNPVNGKPHAVACEADQATVDDAVAAANKALAGEWGQMSVAQRCEILCKVADKIEERFDDFLQAEVADTGKPHSLASHIDIPRGAANFRVFANSIGSFATECFEMDTPDGSGAINYSLRKPLGVIGVISPWNLPLLLMTWKVAPALACGNTVVVKPSEETPSTATLLAEVMDEVGMPAGVFNLVHGFGPDSAGEFLTKHKDISAITFTGETSTGKAIMRAASENVKPLSFELGGKNPGIVFEDANFDDAVEGIGRAIFANTGQVCLATERVYVERSIFDNFVHALKEKAESLELGWPDEERTNFGPLVSKAHQQKVLSYYRLAVSEGANVITGGGVPKFSDERDQGFYVEPTIWTGLSEEAKCVKEEIFGPVCHIAPFDTEQEVIKLANASEYGLASSVWTTNLARGHRVAKALESGTNWVNCWFLRDLRTPFGGTKMSGIGREGGVHSLNFYSEPVNICVKL